MVILQQRGEEMESHLKLEQTTDKLKPEDYLVSTKNISTKSLKILKELYDLTKSCENEEASSSSLQNALPPTSDGASKKKRKQKGKELFSRTEVPLNSLITKDFDEDQIWEELQLQNSLIYDTLVTAVSKVLAHKPRRRGGGDDEKQNSEEEDDILKELQGNDEDEGDLSDFFETDESYRKKKEQTKYSKSIVDDKFFNLAQMTEFVDKMDAEVDKGEKDDSDNEDDIDLFEDEVEEEEETENDYYYKDFFDPPLDEIQTTKQKGKPSQKEDGLNLEEDDDEEEEDEEQEESEDNVELSKKEDETTLSTFEKKRRKIEDNLKTMEEEALQPRSWQLTGEVTAQTRPENSLLEEHLIYDHLLRQAPEITMKTTQKLEDIIKQCVKDQAWDDVIRKIKPIENVLEYKKRLVLDAEKSKMSLTEIYEKEYLDKQKLTEETTEEDKEPEEHKVIQKDMTALFAKLDAMSHFNYNPKAPMPEIKTIRNANATTMEEITPSTYSEAMLLAPQEMLEPAKGEIKGKEERTTTDRKRERRLKKKKQHLKRLAQEDKDRSKGLGLRNIKLAESVVKKSKMRMDSIESPHNNKELKSSKAFFTKLQEQVSSHIDKVAKRKKDSGNLKAVSAKKFKL